MIASRWRGAALALAVGAAAGCGGGSSRPPGNHGVTISWQASHEKGVNAPGGGYRVAVAGRPTVDLPYPSPATLTTVLYTGSYVVSVQAYEPDPVGAGTSWSPASRLTVVVP